MDGGIGRRKQRHTLRAGIRAGGGEGSGGGQWGHGCGSSGWTVAIMRGSGRSVNGGEYKRTFHPLYSFVAIQRITSK